MNIKRISFAFMLVFLLSIATPVAFAKDSIGVNDLSKKYNLKTIEAKDLPQGVTPITFNSIEEADKFLSGISTLRNANQLQVSGQQVKAAASAYNYDNTKAITSYMNLHIAGTLYYQNGVFTRATSPTSYISGVTLGFGWSQTNSGVNFSNGYKKATCWANGLLQYYLIINGVIQVGSQPQSISVVYTL